MNKLRVYFREQVDALLPELHATYRLIGRYQKGRTGRHQEALLAQLDVIGERLAFFKGMMQGPKQPYFDAVANHELSLSDRIVALDIAVGAMHIDFPMERAYMHSESEALKRALEQARYVEGERVIRAGPEDDRVLVRGLAASPGVATGKAHIIRKSSDYRRIPKGGIAVARMTRPELILGVGRVAAIVTDRGGSLCHAAIIARELGIPCVVGTEMATETIRPKQLILVDGSHGIVRTTGSGQSDALDAPGDEGSL